MHFGLYSSSVGNDNSAVDTVVSLSPELWLWLVERYFTVRAFACAARGARRAQAAASSAHWGRSPQRIVSTPRARVWCAALSARSGVVGGQAVGIPAGPPRAHVRVHCLARVQLCLVCCMRAWALSADWR